MMESEWEKGYRSAQVRYSDRFAGLEIEHAQLRARIAELAAFIDKLIETGTGMYEQIAMLYGDGMMSAYIKSMHDWNALVTEWRNREVK